MPIFSSSEHYFDDHSDQESPWSLVVLYPNGLFEPIPNTENLENTENKNTEYRKSLKNEPKYYTEILCFKKATKNTVWPTSDRSTCEAWLENL